MSELRTLQPTDQADIVVIGAGGCGLIAALRAAQQGARVVLLEKTDRPGGGTALSMKSLQAGGTAVQQQQGIADSAAQYARDIAERNGHRSDPALTARLTETSAPLVQWLAETLGLRLRVPEFPFGHSAPRSHTWGTDEVLTDLLFAAIQREPGITTHFATTASALIVDVDGAVTGVATDRGTFIARRVILATGGFGASAELLARYIPAAVGIPFPGHAGSTGDGLAMGLALGAATAHMDAFQPYPAHLGPGKRAVTPEVITSGGIMVGPDGRRFVDETRYPGGLSAGILALPDKHAYEIFDRRILELHRPVLETRAQLAELIREGRFVEADTAAALGEKLGIDGAALAETIRAYNATVGSSDAFGRVVKATLAPPFYGMRVTVALYHTQGGLRIDADGRVLRPDGSPIPHLYAGGGVAMGVSGDGMDGYLPGNGQLASLGLGFIAADHAVRSIRQAADRR
jgi:fumarate reductase flavoprotein subunit